ncbi:MAG: hypothetical protein JNL10_10885 [Verrucomicrobiales bacterium]|nr:hypothetical protein [Verrucomicrobiales bacterium]
MNRLHLLRIAVLTVGIGWASTFAAETKTNSPPADAFVLRRFEWIPAFKSPRTFAPLVPRLSSITAVQDLALAGERLWLSVRTPAQTNPPDGSGRLWEFHDQALMMEPVAGPLEQHRVTTLFGAESTLWMGLNGGMASLDLKQNVIHPFGPAQGMVSTNIVGIAAMDDTIVALGHLGLLWGLVPGTTNFTRATAGAPSVDPRSPELWNHFATSGEWMAALGTHSLAARHSRSPQWIPMREEFANGSPHLSAPKLSCIEGDGDGGFWIGSDAGLHWLNPESNVCENRFWTPQVTVSGGLGMTVAPGFKPTAAAYSMAQERVMQGIRDRMRDRARHARINQRLTQPVSPYWPTSRLPGPVLALHRDARFLWVATREGPTSLRSRVLLMHQATRRWIGWFPVAAPVTCLGTDAQRLWIGCDVSRSPNAPALFAVEKFPMTSTPQNRWIKDTIPAEELADRLASLPVRERAVLAFFGGDPTRVVDLLAPTGTAAPDADAETLFLLAFAHDAVGLNNPDALELYVHRLREQYPESAYAELAAAVRSARPAATLPEAPHSPAPSPGPTGSQKPEPPLPAEASPATPRSEASPVFASPEAAAVLAKRDLGKDGRLNAVEFRLWLGPRADFKSSDTNQDGHLDAGEIDRLLKNPGVTAP